MSVVGLPIGNNLTSEEKQNYLVYQLIAMVIETCKLRWNLDGKTIYKELRNCGAITWLSNGYDCLHTQSMDYIIRDIEEMLEGHGKVGDTNVN